MQTHRDKYVGAELNRSESRKAGEPNEGLESLSASGEIAVRNLDKIEYIRVFLKYQN
jgi:hypothetical protein